MELNVLLVGIESKRVLNVLPNGLTDIQKMPEILTITNRAAGEEAFLPVKDQEGLYHVGDHVDLVFLAVQGNILRTCIVRAIKDDFDSADILTDHEHLTVVGGLRGVHSVNEVLTF